MSIIIFLPPHYKHRVLFTHTAIYFLFFLYIFFEFRLFFFWPILSFLFSLDRKCFRKLYGNEVVNMKSTLSFFFFYKIVLIFIEPSINVKYKFDFITDISTWNKKHIVSIWILQTELRIDYKISTKGKNQIFDLLRKNELE